MMLFKKNKFLLFLLLGILLMVLNFVNHGNFVVATLNIIYLGLTVYFISLFSKDGLKLSDWFLTLPLVIVPIFWYQFTQIKVLLAIILVLLMIIYLKTKVKLLMFFVVAFYLLFASVVVNDIGKLPYSIDVERTIYHLSPTDIAIEDMQKHALFLPFRLRTVVFSESAYIYVLLSRFAELFLLKNFYTILLLANLYPLFKGLISEAKVFNQHKIFYVVFFLPLIIAASARSINIYNAFIFSTPIFLYFILKGLLKVNRKVYYLLLLISLVLVTSPLK